MDQAQSPDDDLIDRFIEAFRGRGDVYGNAKGFCEKRALTRPVFEKHLRSTDPADHIGVYCMVGTNASWGCIDIDGKDFPLDVGQPHTDDMPWDWEGMWMLAKNLAIVLQSAPRGRIHPHIERTKNGYHVWVFPEEPLVPAATMRRALMAACKAIDYDPKEVNPKAEGPRPGTKGYGNFVRLPYGGWLSGTWEPKQRFMVDNHHNPWPLDMWLLGGIIRRTPTPHLEAAAALWSPPKPKELDVDFNAGLDVGALLPMLDGLAYSIWKDGPLPGKDRSNTLAQLAHLCAERGLLAKHAFAIVKSADERWGKFHDRADCDEQLARFIEGAYDE